MSKTVDFGTIKLKKGTTDSGKDYEFFEIDIRQNIDIYFKGEKLDFTTYKLNDGTELENKRVAVTDVAKSLEFSQMSVDNGKLSQEFFNQIKEKFEKQNVQYVLSIKKQNLK